MSQWHFVDPNQGDGGDTQGTPTPANNPNEGSTHPDVQQPKQSQTQSMQQPPDKLDQAQVQQPQTRGDTTPPPQPTQPIALPAGAEQGSITQAVFVPMPSGGLRALAIQLWPDDRDNPDLMNDHVRELFLRNRDVLRDDTSFTVGTMVRIS